MSQSVRAGYICQSCGADHTIDVHERAHHEAVERFVERVAVACGSHHRNVVPACRADRLDIKLPISSNGIGFVGEPLTAAEMAALAKKGGG